MVVVEQVSGTQSRVAARLCAGRIPSSCCIWGTLVKRCAVTTLTWRRIREGMCCGAMRCGVQCHWEKYLRQLTMLLLSVIAKLDGAGVHMLHTHEESRQYSGKWWRYFL
jgi:hypothetical protein